MCMHAKKERQLTLQHTPKVDVHRTWNIHRRWRSDPDILMQVRLVGQKKEKKGQNQICMIKIGDNE